MKLDAHHHLWQYDKKEYDWIDDSMSVLKHNFLLPELSMQMQSSGIDGSIVVQARQSLNETKWLLQLANSSQHIKGVVGWIDLKSEFLEQQLQEFQSEAKLKGFRHVLQGETDPEFMLNPHFIRGLKLLAQYNFTYDLLIFAHQLPKAIEMLSQVPELKVVIDHIAKPDIKKQNGFAEWRHGMSELAKNPTTYCKVSGMVTEANWTNWKNEDFSPYLRATFELFGENRIMFGSDWPVCLVAGTYEQIKSIVEDYTQSHHNTALNKVLGINAANFYGIE